MKFTIHLLIFLLLSAIKLAVGQTQVGTIKIGGQDLPIYVNQSDIDKIVTALKATTTTPTTPPPVIVPPVVVKPAPVDTLISGAQISSYHYEADKGFVITFKIAGTTPQEISWDGTKYFPFSRIYLPTYNTGTYYLKTNGTVTKLTVKAKSTEDAPIIEGNTDNGSVTTPPVIEQTPTTANRPLIGAVRWDWWDDFDCTTLWLSPQKWHYKAPFFAKKISDNQLYIKGNTQELVDKEIEYANYAGLNYFAFNWYQGYDDGSKYNGSYGREKFKKSTKKGNLKMCFILEHTSLNNTQFNFESLKELCADLGRDDYQKINGRPLLFYMTYPPLNPSQVEAINSTYLRFYPNQPLPYIVNAIQVGEQEAQQNNKTGIAAWSQYTGYGKEGDINMRERYKRAGVKLIPTMTVGWHTSPIGEQPCKWYQNAPIEPEIRLTGEALKSHLIDTINFVNANRETCEANTILCYAWNEHAEGGYILPTIIPGSTNINTDTIEIFRQVLNPTQKSF